MINTSPFTASKYMPINVCFDVGEDTLLLFEVVIVSSSLFCFLFSWIWCLMRKQQVPILVKLLPFLLCPPLIVVVPWSTKLTGLNYFLHWLFVVIFWNEIVLFYSKQYHYYQFMLLLFFKHTISLNLPICAVLRHAHSNEGFIMRCQSWVCLISALFTFPSSATTIIFTDNQSTFNLFIFRSYCCCCCLCAGVGFKDIDQIYHIRIFLQHVKCFPFLDRYIIFFASTDFCLLLLLCVYCCEVLLLLILNLCCCNWLRRSCFEIVLIATFWQSLCCVANCTDVDIVP